MRPAHEVGGCSANGFAADREAEFRRLGAELRGNPGDWGLLVRAGFAARDAGLRWEAIAHLVRAYRAGSRAALLYDEIRRMCEPPEFERLHLAAPPPPGPYPPEAWRAWKYPLRGDGFAMLIGGAVALGLLQVVCGGLAAVLYPVSLFVRLLLLGIGAGDVARCAAQGSTEAPEWTGRHLYGAIGILGLGALLGAFTSLPLTFMLMTGAGTDLMAWFAVAAAVVVPAVPVVGLPVLLAAAREELPARRRHPFGWIRGIAAARRDFGAACGVACACALGVVATEAAIAGTMHVAAPFGAILSGLLVVLQVYLALVGAHAWGLFGWWHAERLVEAQR